jgi:hypothetical protein
MDLAKIIGELKLELQCLDAAIAAMVDLVRVQGLHVPEAREKVVPLSSPPPLPSPQVKRGRGRPRKYAAPMVEPSPPPMASETPESSDDSSEPEV